FQSKRNDLTRKELNANRLHETPEGKQILDTIGQVQPYLLNKEADGIYKRDTKVYQYSDGTLVVKHQDYYSIVGDIDGDKKPDYIRLQVNADTGEATCYISPAKQIHVNPNGRREQKAYSLSFRERQDMVNLDNASEVKSFIVNRAYTGDDPV